MEIILDTNFLLYCAKERIDYAQDILDYITEAHLLVTVEQVVDELIDLSETAKKMKDRDSAELALKILKKNNVKVLEVKARNADAAIVKIHKGDIVATLDYKLRKKVGKVLVISGKKQLKLI